MTKIQEFIEDGYQKGDAVRVKCSLGIREGIIITISEEENRIKLRPFEAGKKPISIVGDNIEEIEEIDAPSTCNHDLLAENTDKENVSESSFNLSAIGNLETANASKKCSVNSSNNADTNTAVSLDNNKTITTISASDEKTEISIGNIKLTSLGKIVLPSDPRSQKEEERRREALQTNEYEVTNNNEINATGNNNTPSYQAGDRVSYETLAKWDELKRKEKGEKKKAKKAYKAGSSKTQSFKSLEDLASLDSVVEYRKNDAANVVREMGEINSTGYSDFGFIKDYKTGEKLWFSFSELIDFDKSSPLSLNGEYVVFTRSKNYAGNTAISIHKPNTIEALVKLANDKYSEGQKGTAYEIINHILADFPDSYLANQALQEFTKKKAQPKTYLINGAEYSPINLYKKARDYNDVKDYKKAIETYRKAIEAHQRTDSAVKDLGMIYISLAKKSTDASETEKYLQDAKELMDTYGKLLPQNSVNLSYLENFYYAVRDFEKFKIVANKLLATLDETSDGPRYVFLLNKMSAAYIKEGNTAEARKLLNRAMDIYPSSSRALKLLEIINAPSSKIEERIEEEIESLGSANNEFETFNTRISPFIEETLNRFEDYAGVKAKDSGNFTAQTLKGVRAFIDAFDEKKFSGRPSDRARYLLTEGKLMLQLEPDNTFGLRSVMARYCNDMAKIHIYNNNSIDVIRFYYNEAFALEEKYSATARQVSYYLLTNVYDCKKMSEEINKNISVENALKIVFEDKFDIKKWESILTIFLYNKQIFLKIIGIIFDNQDLYKQSITALTGFGIDCKNINNKEDYQKLWYRAREQRLADYRVIVASLKSITTSSNIEELAIRLSEKLKDCRQEWMCSIDLMRISNIIKIIAPALEKYHKASGFRDKQLNCHEVENLLSQMVDEIEKDPTKLSFEAILPLLKSILQAVNESFENILASSEPSPKLSLLRSESVVDQTLVPLQIEVSIDKDCSPIYNVSIEIVDNAEIETIDSENTTSYAGLIEGGDAHVFQPTVKVSDYVIKKRAVAFEVKCNYFNSGEEKSITTNLSLHLYNPEDFVAIDNPYAAVAESGPLSADSNMFYGQKEYIKQVVDTIMESPSKQVIIYGQKRSGKSSVLNKVQQQLSDAGAFCVQFSMGKIVRNISEFAFYYKILSEIKDSLDMLREDDMIAPDFDIPNRVTFQNEDPENPVETFTKYMRLFKRACKKTVGWENKRLVVLIDEFTYMYGAIKMKKISPTIMMQWKAITQDEKAQFSVVLVGQDVVPSFKQEPYARNAFGVIKDLRLSYLKKEEAHELIVKPIMDGEVNRYNDKAIELIMDYTACNPYYIQIFCSYLVNYMNEKHYNSVTEADVLDVASELITGVNALDKAKFENLLSSGETDNEEDDAGNEVDDAIKTYSDNDVETILKAVAKASSNKIWAPRNDISTSLSYETEQGILDQLCNRDVLDDKDEKNYYKIKVRLYKEWLLKH